jgi:hypothetical protein
MSSWVQRYIQPRPTSRPEVPRTSVDGACPECGAADIERYPVATAHGARMATKCQSCLHILLVERPGPDDAWPPFRAMTYDWDASIAERASRDTMDRGDER